MAFLGQHTRRLVGLGGSMRDQSRSRAGLRAALEMAQTRGFEVELLDVRELNLPIYIPYLPTEQYPADAQANIRRLMDTVRRADAMVWASPTYHGAVSGVFKNTIDYLEYLGDDTLPYLHGIPVGLMACNDPVTNASMVMMVAELKGWPAPTQITLGRVHFDEQMKLIDERIKRKMGQMIDELWEFKK